VVRNEEPLENYKHLWKKYDGQPIEFKYLPEAHGDGMYFWLPVQCEVVLDIRVELGFPREPEFPLHLTVGNNR
jgi:hypothetical protein